MTDMHNIAYWMAVYASCDGSGKGLDPRGWSHARAIMGTTGPDGNGPYDRELEYAIKAYLRHLPIPDSYKIFPQAPALDDGEFAAGPFAFGRTLADQITDHLSAQKPESEG